MQLRVRLPALGLLKKCLLQVIIEKLVFLGGSFPVSNAGGCKPASEAGEKMSAE